MRGPDLCTGWAYTWLELKPFKFPETSLPQTTSSFPIPQIFRLSSSLFTRSAHRLLGEIYCAISLCVGEEELVWINLCRGGFWSVENNDSGLDNNGNGEIDLGYGTDVDVLCSSGGDALYGGAAVVLGGGGKISSTVSLSPLSSSEFRFPTLPELSEKDPPLVVLFFSTNSLTALGMSLRRFSTKNNVFLTVSILLFV